MAEEIKDGMRYKHGDIDCWTAMEAAFGKDAVMTFDRLNAFKYIWRCDHKGGDKDIEKAVVYLNHYLKLSKEKQDEDIINRV